MRLMRMLPSIALLLGAVAPAVAHGETLREQSRRTVDLAGVSTVTVQNARGRIEARPSPDKSLHVTALKIVRASGAAVARRLAEQTLVELARDGARYSIRVRYPRAQSVRINLFEGFNELTIPRVEVQLTVDVPSGIQVELGGASADLHGEGLAGPVTLKCASGDASVRSCDGPVLVSTASGDVSLSDVRSARVSTASGDVQIESARGPVSVHATSGDVSVAQTADSLGIETVSGDVTVARAPAGVSIGTTSGEIDLGYGAGRVRLESVSGDVRAALHAPLAQSDISTTSGDIRLGIAESVGCALELRTSSGTLDLDIPCRTRMVSRRLVTAIVRGGTTPVSLRSLSGSITVTRGEP